MDGGWGGHSYKEKELVLKNNSVLLNNSKRWKEQLLFELITREQG